MIVVAGGLRGVKYTIMKLFLSIVIGVSLAHTGFSQSENVSSGTNGVVVSPDNFWIANYVDNSASLGLGTAAQSNSIDFQSASATLTGLANQGVTDPLSASDNLSDVDAATALSNLGVSLNVSSATLPVSSGGTGAASAASARSSLELGTAAQSNSTAFQPASATLTNIANIVGLDMTSTTVAPAEAITVTIVDGLITEFTISTP